MTPLHSLVVLWVCCAAVNAFEFTFSPPKSCGKLDLAWTGGKAPFVLNIIPIFGSPRNITIPSNSFANGVGTFSTILALNVNTSVVLAMSDATGFATGGISKRLDLGPDSAGTCDLTPPPLPWNYVNPNSLTQCAHFFFNGFNGTFTPPVQFVGLVPGGSFFILSGTDTIDWLANVPGHTDLIFVGQDAAGRQGGSSDINTVGQSVDNSCLNQSGQDITTTTNVPTSKTATTSQTSASSPTSTSTSTSASGSPTNTSAAPGDNTSHVPLIAGSIAGIVVGLAVIASLGYFCWQHQRKQRNSWDPPNNRQSKRQTVDLLQAPPPPSSYIRSYTSPSTTSLPHNRTASPFDDPPLPAGHEPRPFTLQAPEDPDYAIGAAGVAAGAANSRRISQTTTSTRRTKGPMPNYQPPRLIMHTDIEETEETPNEDGFIELPPQYSAARKPLSSFNGSQSGMSSIPEGSQYSQTPYSGPSHESDPFVSNLSRPSSHESHPPYRAS